MVVGKTSLTLIATVLKLGIVVIDVSDKDGDLTDADQRLLRLVGGGNRQRVLSLLLTVKALRGGDDPWGHRHRGTEPAERDQRCSRTGGSYNCTQHNPKAQSLANPARQGSDQTNYKSCLSSLRLPDSTSGQQPSRETSLRAIALLVQVTEYLKDSSLLLWGRVTRVLNDVVKAIPTAGTRDCLVEQIKTG